MRYDVPIVESAAANASQAIWMDKGAPVVGSMDAYAQSFESVTNKFFAPAKEAFPRPFDPLFAGDNSKLDSLSAADVIKKLDLSTHE